MLFVLRGSILPTISPQLIIITLFAALVTALHGQILDWKVSLNFVPFSLIGVSLAIFLGFRNSTSYARYWEARTLWGQVLAATRSLGRQTLTLSSNRPLARPMILHLCAFAHLLKHQLARTDPSTDIHLFLDEADSQRVLQAEHRPAMALLLASEWLGERLKAGEVTPPIATAFERNLHELSTALSGCERIADTPLPFPYSVIIHRCAYLYCFWLPFGLLDGIGLMTPVIVCFIAYTFLRAIGPEPWNAAYVEPSRRPADGRYGENPNRLYQHHQFQVVMKPSPSNIQELYLESLEKLGINPLEHDIRFVEDNWENPSTGSAGLGWEVWLDGMEITQFTYFQQVGGLATGPVTSEVTYGLERLASYIQEVDSVYDIEWAPGVKYGEIFLQPEYEHSKYSFEVSDQDMLLENFEKFEKEAGRALELGLVHPAYDYVLKCSHTFNLLDARGAVSVTERAGYIARIRNLARVVAKTFVAERKKLGYPLLDEATRAKLLAEEEE